MEPSNLPPQAPPQNPTEHVSAGSMDVVVQQNHGPAPEAAPAGVPGQSATSDLLPAIDNQDPAASDVPVETEAPQQQKAAKSDPQTGRGTGLPIFAAVVIVIALAALAVFAYLKSSGSL